MHIINMMVFVVLATTSLFQDSQPYQWNKKSTLTVQEQVEFPGIVLAPGVYVVRLKEPSRRTLAEGRSSDSPPPRAG